MSFRIQSLSKTTHVALETNVISTLVELTFFKSLTSKELDVLAANSSNIEVHCKKQTSKSKNKEYRSNNKSTKFISHNYSA